MRTRRRGEGSVRGRGAAQRAGQADRLAGAGGDGSGRRLRVHVQPRQLRALRASYELARKCARAGIPLLATISAPTSLAVDIARRAGVALASFCRHNGFVEYTA
ncbi:formate dehydrogenase accessory sulfurtransferase FdhD [Chromobacterium piscinae]|uniref:formate dehydrogenase accessory sulfurtransferase FdhD n=1 Tax=Chromobacterium piscinae TaxID=686831 RepID=UPI0032609342